MSIIGKVRVNINHWRAPTMVIGVVEDGELRLAKFKDEEAVIDPRLGYAVVFKRVFEDDGA